MLTSYLAAADVCVLPFESILNSGSLALAGGYGVPVIAPALPGLRESLPTQYPLTYTPGSTTSLGQALARIKELDLTSVSEQLSTHASTWTWTDAGRATATAYRRALHPGSSCDA